MQRERRREHAEVPDDLLAYGGGARVADVGMDVADLPEKWTLADGHGWPPRGSERAC